MSDIDQEWAEVLDSLSRDVYFLGYDLFEEQAPDEAALNRARDILLKCVDELEAEKKRWQGKEESGEEPKEDDIPF